MKCLRCGLCCFNMFVIIPFRAHIGLMAAVKPGDVLCPNLKVEKGSTCYACAVHDLPEYQGSPCWTYGNSDVDPDFLAKRGQPCRVGGLVLKRGGLRAVYPLARRADLLHDLEFLGPWALVQKGGRQ